MDKAKKRNEYTDAIRQSGHIKRCLKCLCKCVGVLYQCSMCVGGTTRGCMGIAVGCSVRVTVCCSASIVVGIGKYQALAQILS